MAERGPCSVLVETNERRASLVHKFRISLRKNALTRLSAKLAKASGRLGYTSGPGGTLRALAMGVGSVANVSSDPPRPSYLRACHTIYPQSVPHDLPAECATRFTLRVFHTIYPQSVPPNLQVDFKLPIAKRKAHWRNLQG